MKLKLTIRAALLAAVLACALLPAQMAGAASADAKSGITVVAADSGCDKGSDGQETHG